MHKAVQSTEEIQNHPLMEQFIIKMSPAILKYIRAKVKSFVKHVIAPTFNSYDLRLSFNEDLLKVHIEGYVWAKQFNQVNQRIAEDPQVEKLPEVLPSVLLHKLILPTASLNWKVLSKSYQIDEIRAKEIVNIAQQRQKGTTDFPLSLLDLWTPQGWVLGS